MTETRDIREYYQQRVAVHRMIGRGCFGASDALCRALARKEAWEMLDDEDKAGEGSIITAIDKTSAGLRICR